MSQNSSRTFQPFKMETLDCLKRQGPSYPVVQHHVPEECNCKLYIDHVHLVRQVLQDILSATPYSAMP